MSCKVQNCFLMKAKRSAPIMCTRLLGYDPFNCFGGVCVCVSVCQCVCVCVCVVCVCVWCVVRVCVIGVLLMQIVTPNHVSDFMAACKAKNFQELQQSVRELVANGFPAGKLMKQVCHTHTQTHTHTHTLL